LTQTPRGEGLGEKLAALAGAAEAVASELGVLPEAPAAERVTIGHLEVTLLSVVAALRSAEALRGREGDAGMDDASDDCRTGWDDGADGSVVVPAEVEAAFVALRDSLDAHHPGSESRKMTGDAIVTLWMFTCRLLEARVPRASSAIPSSHQRG
jgi:hypothetical protein